MQFQDLEKALGLRNCKVVVFIEPEPLTDKFEQLMLTDEGYKAVLKAIYENVPKCVNDGHKDCCKTLVSNDEIKHAMPNVRVTYTEGEIGDAI